MWPVQVRVLNSPKEWPANAARLAKLHEDTRVRPRAHSLG